MLDAATERELYFRYRDKRDIAARDKILANCLRFVIKIARKYSDSEERLKELVSAGNVGLLAALDKYDPSYNTRFLTYAANWIMLYIRNELYDTNLVAVPLWRQKAVRKIDRVQVKIAVQKGRNATDNEICKNAEITPEQLKNLTFGKFRYLPIEDTNVSCDGIEMKTASQEMRDALEDLLDTLSAKEQYVLRAYFGFAHDPWSLRQIANMINVTSERVRQIKEKALRKLKYRLAQRRINQATA